MAEKSLRALLGLADPDRVWELFHENSKNGRSALEGSHGSLEDTQKRMKEHHECLEYSGFPIVPLPKELVPLTCPLDQAIVARRSVREMASCRLRLEQVATLLHYSYGMLRDNVFTSVPARTRAVPSAGALYPLEIYVHGANVAGLEPGIFHYSPKDHCLHVLSAEDLTRQVANSTLYPQYVGPAAMVIFITALFERTTWKYGERGYRYALVEAGHVAQNLALVASAMGLAAFSLGGYYDREIDHLIDVDGVTQSTVCMVCVGAAPTAGG
jgi:SagB-type dehydrogenase family enzyme